jgi:nucleoside-diphosphate-sugar epimerase
MKNVLVTGASGFIGQHTLDLLVERGYVVHAVSSSIKPPTTNGGVTWHQADLLEEKTTAELLFKLTPTHLLHFAWYAEPAKYWQSAKNMHWLQASINLLRHFHASGGRRAVMAGSCAEYDWNYGYLSEEFTPSEPATFYGICKKALADSMLSYGASQGLSCAWGRIFFLYGPGEHPVRFVSSVITALLRNEVAAVSHCRQIRDFLYVKDVAAAFVALLESSFEGKVNIASGNPVRLERIVEVIASQLNAHDKIRFGAHPATHDPPLLVGDCRTLNDIVGWRPGFDLNAGIGQTIDFWKGKIHS